MANNMANSATVDGRRILVTGGAGFVGSHLLDRLNKDNEIVVIDNFRYGKKENIAHISCTLLEDDICTADLAAIIRNHEIDLIFHLAAAHLSDSLNDPMNDFMTSALGGIRVLEAARNTQVKRVVYASTGSVYGEPKHEGHDESHPLLPTTPYGVSKCTSDHYCRIYRDLYGLETVRLRYYNIYGPRRTIGAVPQFIIKALRGDTIRIEGGEQIRTPTFVTDIAEATIKAAVVPEANGLAFNLAASTAVSILEMAQTIARLCGAEDSINFEMTDYRPGEIMVLRPDVTLAKRVLAWEARVTLEEGIESLIDHLRQGEHLS